MNCQEFNENLPLFLYDELAGEQRAACEAHVAACSACQKALGEHRLLHEVLSQRLVSEPSPDFLVQCRQALEETLDHEELGWRGLLSEWGSVLRPAPGFALAVTLMALGFGLGWTIRPHATRSLPPSPSSAEANVAGNSLENMRISGISRVAPDPKTGEVRITMDAEHRVTLEGSLDDPRIQQVLVYAVKSYDNPGIRRDTLDALRMASSSPAYRQALIDRMQHDPNLGVRLEALDAVRGLEWGPDLRQAFLGTVEHDRNDGMRVAAIDVLAGHADQGVVPALERVSKSDSCPYVRMKSAKAIRASLKIGN
jgi:hypothetical protein